MIRHTFRLLITIQLNSVGMRFKLQWLSFLNMVTFWLISMVAVTLAQNTHNPSRPDIYGLVNILYLKADANLDSTITKSELSDVFKGFDKNADGTVTHAEFVELWMRLTLQTKPLANAYFHLADLHVDNVLNQQDYDLVYHVFDLNHDGSVSAPEFAKKWEDIIRETPFVVLFERSDIDTDGFLSQSEFRSFFSSFDTNADGKVDNTEFDNGWGHADFALMSDADMLFGDMDVNNDGYITDNTNVSDLDSIFTIYNVDGDSKLSLREVIQMKTLLVLTNNQPGTIG